MLQVLYNLRNPKQPAVMPLQSDIWSLGIVLYELVTMKHAFDAPNMRALIQKVVIAVNQGNVL